MMRKGFFCNDGWPLGRVQRKIKGSREVVGVDPRKKKEFVRRTGNLALEVFGQDWSSELISIFLEDWEVGRVALSCHLSMDLLCQEMSNACGESSESLGSPRSFTVFRVPGRKVAVF